jgi:hemerythrin-like metal-binding protein
MQAEEAQAELARQHASIASRLDAFSQRIYGTTQLGAVALELRELLVEIGMHFGFEEALMEAGGYAQFEHHRRQHMSLVVELGLLLDRLAVAAHEESVRSADFLAQWYRQHVAHSDALLAQWLATRA